MRRLRSDESGFSLIELLVASAIGAGILAIAGGLLVSAVRTGLFTDGQVITIDDTRTAVERMSKELRGADSIVWCAPSTNCLQVGAQTPTGGFRTVRYTRSGEDLRREVFDNATSTWSEPEILIERVVNGVDQPIFSCDVQSSLLKVNVDLAIQPTPQSDPVLNMKTSVRPRNFPSKATCP
jgi:prepilin-type N-terminal cleavage/methylation domain-containing protein